MKCDACPVRDLPWACPAHTKPHPTFCRLAARDRSYDAIIRRLCLESQVPEGETGRRPSPAPPPPPLPVALLAAAIPTGGLRTVLTGLLRQQPRQLQWQGLAVAAAEVDAVAAPTAEAALAEMRTVTDVRFGTAALPLLRSAQAIVVLGPVDLPRWVEETRAAVVALQVPGRPGFDVPTRHPDRVHDVVYPDGVPAAASRPDLPTGAGALPAGIDQFRLVASRSRLEARADLQVGGRHAVGVVTALTASCGAELLPEMIGRLPDAFVGYVVGWGDDAAVARVRDAIARHAPGRCWMIGPRDDLANVLVALDTLLVPGLTPGLGTATLEAWMSRIPVLAGDTATMAARHPDLVCAVPRGASGATFARALLADLADPLPRLARVDRAASTALAAYDIRRYEEAWAWRLGAVVNRRRTVLAGAGVAPAPTVPPPPPAAPDQEPSIQNAVAACPWRFDANCGCPGKYRCALNRGPAAAPLVTWQDCRVCVLPRVLGGLGWPASRPGPVTPPVLAAAFGADAPPLVRHAVHQLVAALVAGGHAGAAGPSAPATVRLTVGTPPDPSGAAWEITLVSAGGERPAGDRVVASSPEARHALPAAAALDAAVIPWGAAWQGRGDRDAVRASWGVAAGTRVLAWAEAGSAADRDRRLQVLAALGADWHGVVLEPAEGGADPSSLRYVGVPESLADALAAADVVWAPAPEAGGDLVLAAAWRAGTPVVADGRGVAGHRASFVLSVPEDADPATWARSVRYAQERPEYADLKRVRDAKLYADANLSLERSVELWAEFLARLGRLEPPRGGSGKN